MLNFLEFAQLDNLKLAGGLAQATLTAVNDVITGSISAFRLAPPQYNYFSDASIAFVFNRITNS